MPLFDQLSLAWRVWGYGLLGAMVFMLIVLIVAESRSFVGLWRALFTEEELD